MFHYTFGIPPKRATSLRAHFRVFAPAGNTTVPFEEILQRLQAVGNRGGVEDIRLEAKDTKKIRGQGQGQPFRGQTLSRPRTGMLEAKAKDQRHSRKSSQKKKSFQKSFSGNHQFMGVARTFDWGGLNHKSHEMTSPKICLLALNQDFANGEGLNKYS